MNLELLMETSFFSLMSSFTLKSRCIPLWYLQFITGNNYCQSIIIFMGLMWDCTLPHSHYQQLFRAVSLRLLLVDLRPTNQFAADLTKLTQTTAGLMSLTLAKASFSEATERHCNNCSLLGQELQYRNTNFHICSKFASWHVHCYKTVQARPIAEQTLAC